MLLILHILICGTPLFANEINVEGKLNLLGISHSMDARYYLGRYEKEHFYPEEHHRMN